MGGVPIICEWWVMSNTGKSAINIPDAKITMSVHSSFLPAYLPSFFLFFFSLDNILLCTLSCFSLLPLPLKRLGLQKYTRLTGCSL